MILTDADLPGAWKNADDESRYAQQLTLWLTKGRLGGGLVAAAGGAISWRIDRVDVAAWTILIGVLSALICEVVSWVTHSEQAWYEGRAVAESVKTLAWRYAVCADPFPVSMTDSDAKTLLRERISTVTSEVSERIVFDANSVVTHNMNILRAAPFEDRRDTYINGRTVDQKNWYAKKARLNRGCTIFWRSTLIIFDALVFGLACSRLSGGWTIDFAGLLGALIAAGTAWVSVKQFSPLASAYAVATKELGIQESKLRMVNEKDWALVAADAEEAISREHTTWLASRTGRLPNWIEP